MSSPTAKRPRSKSQWSVPVSARPLRTESGPWEAMGRMCAAWISGRSMESIEDGERDEALPSVGVFAGEPHARKDADHRNASEEDPQGSIQAGDPAAPE